MSPEAVALIQALASAALVVTLMGAVGLRLHFEDLRALPQRPALLISGLIVNILLIPAVAALLIVPLGLGLGAAVGIILVAAAPGGPAAALYAQTARSDLPLAVGLTIVLPAVGVITTPATVSLVVGLVSDTPGGAGTDGLTLALKMAGALIGLQLLPLVIGMLIRGRRPALADALAPRASSAANAMLAAVTLLLLVLKGHVLFVIPIGTWICLVSLITACVLLGHIGGRVARGSQASVRSSALVAGSRNIAVAILLASTLFSDPVTDAVVLTFGLFSLLVPLSMAVVWRRGG